MKYTKYKLCIKLVFVYTIDLSVGVSDTVFQLNRKLYLKNESELEGKLLDPQSRMKETGGKNSIMSSFVTFITD